MSPPTHRFREKFGSEVGISGEDWRCSAEPSPGAYNDLSYFEFSYRVLVRKQKSTPTLTGEALWEAGWCRSQDDTEMSFQTKTRTAEELLLLKKVSDKDSSSASWRQRRSRAREGGVGKDRGDRAGGRGEKL